ncbi:hypothetical protein IT415_02955 [bacterium]|nr:hypothetical protein [bacterium]
MSNVDDEPGRELSAYEEIVGIDTPDGREQLKEALQGMRDLAVQHTPRDESDPDWRLTEEERAAGRRGVQEARAAIRATESPTERLAREKREREQPGSQPENDPQ